MTRFLYLLTTAALFIVSTSFNPARADTAAMTDLWDELLSDHVRPGQIDDIRTNLVDYEAISKDPRWKELLTSLETISIPESREEKLAFWTNVYNIMAIKVVLKKYPVRSIRNVGGWFTKVWDIDAGNVAGEMRTLTEIEHHIIRPMGDARIHAAVVCAALSCPPLRREAYRAEKLDEQFDEQMRVWLDDEVIGLKVERNGSRVRVSSIFDWFAEDFEEEAGSVRAYLDKYLSDEKRQSIQEDARIVHLRYNWNLNDTKNDISEGGN
ncbi:MAG: DUF547 domain-containing protein [Candidatus Sumerlaeia bacterium]|nr:DUF547 domain-containing protein [Candidatus Sumerlaeia bacterium]